MASYYLPGLGMNANEKHDFEILILEYIISGFFF